MIAVMPQMRLLVAVEPVDFRKGIDGLAAVCRQRLQTDPMSGAVFVFGSRNRKSLKILVYDGQGFFLCQNMHAPHCAVIEVRNDSVPLPSALRSGTGCFRRCGRATRSDLYKIREQYNRGHTGLDV